MSDTDTTSKISEGAHIPPKESDDKAAGISAESSPDAPADSSAGASPSSPDSEESTQDSADKLDEPTTDPLVAEAREARDKARKRARDAEAERDSLRAEVAVLREKQGAYEQLEREHSQLVESTRQANKATVIDAIADKLNAHDRLALITGLVDVALVEGVDLDQHATTEAAVAAIMAQLGERVTAHRRQVATGGAVGGKPGRPRAPRHSSAI